MTDILHPGRLGCYELSYFDISSNNIRAMIEGITPGRYIKLTCNGNILMSDTPMERRTNSKFVSRSFGDVLIGGLGIGMILAAIQDKPEVKSITVLEKSSDLIKLVFPQLCLNEKVTVINADVFDWKPPKGKKYDCVYMDIWGYINSDVYKEMVKLKRKYSHYLKPKDESPCRFNMCWAEYEAKNNRRLI